MRADPLGNFSFSMIVAGAKQQHFPNHQRPYICLQQQFQQQQIQQL